jgi:hypothetical protein
MHIKYEERMSKIEKIIEKIGFNNTLSMMNNSNQIDFSKIYNNDNLSV